MAPPDESREAIREWSRKQEHPVAAHAGMLLATAIGVALVYQIPKLLTWAGLEWTYAWFTRSSFNEPAAYPLYFLLVGGTIYLLIRSFANWKQKSYSKTQPNSEHEPSD